MIATAPDIGTERRGGNLAVIVTVLLLLAIAFITLCLKPNPVSDLYWQLRVGHDIVTTHHVPTTDPYSWTRHGTPWIAPEWLSYLPMWAAYHSAGYAGVWALLVGCVLVMACLLWTFTYRVTRSPWLSLLWVVMAGAAMQVWLEPRPFLITYILLPIFVYILRRPTFGYTLKGMESPTPGPSLKGRESRPTPGPSLKGRESRPTPGPSLKGRENKPDRDGQRQAPHSTVSDQAPGVDVPPVSRTIWLLPVLTILWANMHQAVLAVVAIVFFYGLAAFVEAVRSTEAETKAALMRRARGLLAVALAYLFATFVNPYTWHFHADAIATLLDPTALSKVAEWWPITKLPQSMFVWFYIFVGFIAVILAASREKRDLADMLLLVLMLISACLHARQVALFVPAAAVLLPRHLASAAGRLESALKRDDLARIRPLVIPAAALVCIAFILRDTGPTIGQINAERGPLLTRVANVAIGVDQRPSKACDFIERVGFPASLRMYNSYGVGGYLILELPDHPVFIDGRATPYLGTVMDDYKSTASRDTFLAMLDKYQVDFAVVTTDEGQYLRDNPDWVVVFRDVTLIDGKPNLRARIFIRRRPELASLIAKCQADAVHGAI